MEETPQKKVDIIKHILIPPFRKLTKEEADKVLLKFDISALQLPQISIKDPMAKAVDSKLGEIIEIEHKNPTGGKDLFYRRVIA